ncbi:MAG: PAS domain-containing protein, partial [Chloroflexota bacterium]|nr:PAS domain-containing protein [Chloroflexota bacterium]
MMTISKISAQDTLWLRDRVVGATGISVLIADARLPDAPVVDVNPSFEQLTGYAPEDVLGRNCRFLQGPGSDPGAVKRMRMALDRAQEFTGVLLNYRRDGTPFWNEINISPVYDQGGILTHFVGLQQDVTQRERANRQLQLLAETSDIIAGGDLPVAIVEAVL